MEQIKQDFLVNEKLGRLMPKYTIPCILSLLVGALYNIVDQIFIANADYLGSYGNAANTVVFPLTVIALGLAVMIGDRACAFVSISLGSNKKDDAHRGVGNAILLCVIISIVLTAVYLGFAEPILMAFGGRVNGETFACSKEYFYWIALGMPFYIFGQTEYAQIPLAVLGIVMKFFQIAISISIGLAAGCIPIAGYNIGANRKDRAKKLLTYLLAAETIIGLLAVMVVELFPRQLIGIFGAGNESIYYTAFTVKSLRIYLCMMELAMVNKGTFIYLQALGKAALSITISMTREIVFGVFLPIIFPIFWGLDGILYSFPAADILTFAITAVIIRKIYKSM